MSLLTDLQSTGLPVAYRFFQKPQATPFIVYYQTDSNNFPADNKVYQHIMGYTIELYTDTKRPDLEALVEQALENYVWEKSEEYVDSEKCFEIIYDVEV